ncbi:MAG: BolA family protein [Bdellovibrio sp.]
MSTRALRIRDILQGALSPVHMELENESFKHAVPPGSESHFKVLIVSDKFTGLSRLDRQRLVNELLQAELKTGLHALAQKTLTPQEWEAQKSLSFESPDCLGGSDHDKRKG